MQLGELMRRTAVQFKDASPAWLEQLVLPVTPMQASAGVLQVRRATSRAAAAARD